MCVCLSICMCIERIIGFIDEIRQSKLLSSARPLFATTGTRAGALIAIYLTYILIEMNEALLIARLKVAVR